MGTGRRMFFLILSVTVAIREQVLGRAASNRKVENSRHQRA